MTPDARTIGRIAQVLTSTGAPGTFATRRTASAGELHIDVVGVGPIPLPLSSASARHLCGIARPARYGLRDQTLLDRNVRDAWEIGKRQVRIDEKRWRRTLDPELEHIARELGLAEGCALRAELHNLLVYGPGQFFATHQDSEKADGMIGTLVVLLPSESKGGALVIEHNDEKVSYRGSADRLTLVAFYADCQHAVRPVTTGYRAALTYNLFLDGATQRPPERLVDGQPRLVGALDLAANRLDIGERIHLEPPGRQTRGPWGSSDGRAVRAQATAGRSREEHGAYRRCARLTRSLAPVRQIVSARHQRLGIDPGFALAQLEMQMHEVLAVEQIRADDADRCSGGDRLLRGHEQG